ncbi:hypothetical protein [Streptomyces sp. 058-1L]|uniref:hypothetical protein n=1 Tax=Streptomyces sp. 058-1L TaxID=2789266 RepID=UPI00397F8594
MDVVIGRPVVVWAPCGVSTDGLEQDIRARFVHPKLKVWLRHMRGTGVVERSWSAPLAVIIGRKGIWVRSRAAYEAARDRAVTAAGQALVHFGLGPGDIDVLVHAVRSLRGRGGGRGLVVAAEDLSTLYRNRPGELRMQDGLYSGLFGDAAGAAVLSAVEQASAGDLVVEDVWELVLPSSADVFQFD